MDLAPDGTQVPCQAVRRALRAGPSRRLHSRPPTVQRAALCVRGSRPAPEEARPAPAPGDRHRPRAPPPADPPRAQVDRGPEAGSTSRAGGSRSRARIHLQSRCSRVRNPAASRGELDRRLPSLDRAPLEVDPRLEAGLDLLSRCVSRTQGLDPTSSRGGSGVRSPRSSCIRVDPRSGARDRAAFEVDPGPEPAIELHSRWIRVRSPRSSCVRGGSGSGARDRAAFEVDPGPEPAIELRSRWIRGLDPEPQAGFIASRGSSLRTERRPWCCGAAGPQDPRASSPRRASRSRGSAAPPVATRRTLRTRPSRSFGRFTPRWGLLP
jgi:hypothetical protein